MRSCFKLKINLHCWISNLRTTPRNARTMLMLKVKVKVFKIIQSCLINVILNNWTLHMLISKTEEFIASLSFMHTEKIHPEKVTVWCAIHAHCFFKNTQKEPVTEKGVRYRAKLDDYFFSTVVEFWFKDDSSTCHNANAKSC